MTINTIRYTLPAGLQSAVDDALAAWTAKDGTRRLWAGDSTLWTGADEAKWLGWLTITADMLTQMEALTAFAADVRAAGFEHILLLGMGGSSLCPEVLRMTFGVVPGYPELHVLDSTDPVQVKAFDDAVDLSKTLVIVASKSGSTLEPNIFKQYFFARMVETVGADRAGSHFVAITDPGSKMQQVAESDGFRYSFYGVPTIGGRYSALSMFGMVPASAMGLDVRRFLENAQAMADACRADSPAQNPGVLLGLILGAAANSKCDKLTVITTSEVYDFGAWLEQLVAESTGKIGKGIIPVDREYLASSEVYGEDRLFVYIRASDDQDEAVTALEAAGQPVIRIDLDDIYTLGAEFFRWEIATAVAGAVIGINPFDQPDVEASKIATKAITSAYEQDRMLPSMLPILQEGGISLYADTRNEAALKAAAPETLAGYLKAHIDRLTANDYFALSAYIPMNAENEAALQQLRHFVRDRKRVATCLGFGPRFLHSTGQAYKGGPNTGVFLQVTCDDALDLPVPGQLYTFGIVKEAQARGDYEVLAERERRALRIHLSSDLASSFDVLTAIFSDILADEA